MFSNSYLSSSSSSSSTNDNGEMSVTSKEREERMKLIYVGSFVLAFFFAIFLVIFAVHMNAIAKKLEQQQQQQQQLITNTEAPMLQENIISPKLNETKKNEEKQLCGLSGPTRLARPSKTNRIINGDVTFPYQYPWIVSFRMIDKYDSSKIRSHFCAGSLISDTYVISTAHCFSTRNATKIAVIIGINNLNDKLADKNIYYISKLYSHPEFDPKKDYINDIAIIKLNRPVITYNYDVIPICLPKSSSSTLKFNIIDKEVTLIGWGYVDYRAKTLASDLKQMNRKISNNISLCSYIRFNPKTTYCAVNVKNKVQDTCNGDSGGPMMIPIDDKWHLFGLTSFGDTSCNPTKSSYYAKINIYLDWIENVLRDKIN